MKNIAPMQLRISDDGDGKMGLAGSGAADRHDVEWHDVASGKPMQNNFVASLNGGLGDEALNELTPTEFAARPNQTA